MPLVSTEWLNNNLNNVKIIDCSWHMPNSKRDGYKEFLNGHIENAIFFDLDKNSNQNTSIPHMLTDKINWEKIVSSLGISNNDQIVIYDNSEIISSCRCWYNFIYYGHLKNLVHVLDGGLKKWKLEKRKITNKLSKLIKSNYKANEQKYLVKNKKEIDENINKPAFTVIDARSKGRFEGTEPEPRKDLKSGSIPKSICLPFKECINPTDNTFLDKNILKMKFEDLLKKKSESEKKDLVFSCGSGVTAAVLSLAYSLINDKYLPTIYDGSWAEYGKLK
tara:strand:+ start:469 stop:1299 length:831 start_codon:yes stop_codon:yes gene_type:complete